MQLLIHNHITILGLSTITLVFSLTASLRIFRVFGQSIQHITVLVNRAFNNNMFSLFMFLFNQYYKRKNTHKAFPKACSARLKCRHTKKHLFITNHDTTLTTEILSSPKCFADVVPNWQTLLGSVVGIHICQ